ncbi:DUF4403 family protein [Litoribacter ruber]|uniref:DUF4403 family protein n=1 Tax=Litoribacter ruber TaxID=702568 RepID=UPI001BDB5DF3|nr:DUF4403 family protein [Litoribacter ruber]MBT0812196.1 DUF4403 family protein [Litoribacter ruber]
MRKFLYIALITFAFSACKGINPEKPKSSQQAAPLPEAKSSIYFPLEIPLSSIEQKLNQEFKDLLFAEKQIPVGSGLTTDVEVTKTGNAKLSPYMDKKLMFQLPMHLKGKLNVEKKLFGQTISTAIPFDEMLAPEISFRPEIGEDYSIQFADVQIEGWGRPLQYELLGYKLDLDPLLRKHLQKLLESQLVANNFQGVNFRGVLQSAWQNFSEPLPFSQNGHQAFVTTRPHTLFLTEEISGQNLKLHVGLEGDVATTVGQKPAVKSNQLPKLAKNNLSKKGADITLPISIGYAQIDHYLNTELVGELFQIEKGTVLIPKKFTTQDFGDRALVKMNFTAKRTGKKDLSGDLYLVGKPAYDSEREAIYFEEIEFDLNTKNLLANSANWLKQNKITTEIEKRAFFPIGEYLEEAKTEIRKHSDIQTDFASISIKNPKLDVLGIYTTPEDVRLYLHSTGDVDVRIKQL